VRGFEPHTVQHNGFNIFQFKNIVVPGGIFALIV
jgi:hypothetical protein